MHSRGVTHQNASSLPLSFCVAIPVLFVAVTLYLITVHRYSVDARAGRRGVTPQNEINVPWSFFSPLKLKRFGWFVFNFLLVNKHIVTYAHPPTSSNFFKLEDIYAVVHTSLTFHGLPVFKIQSALNTFCVCNFIESNFSPNCEFQSDEE